MNNSSYYNTKGQPMTPEAFHALQLANIWDKVEARYRTALMVYYDVPYSLLTRARQLVAMDRAEAKMMAQAKGTQAESLPYFLRKQVV